MNANVKLSENEMQLVTDARFILTKNSIIEKVYYLFGELCKQYREIGNDENSFLPREVTAISPKIYKGENYESLPYVMLDYPRYFTKQDVLAIRCFFWWGNFFSISLHISGRYQEQYFHSLFRNEIICNHWYFDEGNDRWDQSFNHYIPINSLLKKSDLSIFKKRDYIRIAKKTSLDKWDEAYEFFLKSYEELWEMLRS